MLHLSFPDANCLLTEKDSFSDDCCGLYHGDIFSYNFHSGIDNIPWADTNLLQHLENIENNNSWCVYDDDGGFRSSIFWLSPDILLVLQPEEGDADQLNHPTNLLLDHYDFDCFWSSYISNVRF